MQNPGSDAGVSVFAGIGIASHLPAPKSWVLNGLLFYIFLDEARLAVNFSTILSAVKPRDRTDQYVILAALHSLNAETVSVTVKQISQVLKLHLGSKTPSSLSASLRKYSSYVEPVESGPGTAFDTDVGIVCALEQPEFDAVREALGGAKAWKEIGDERVALKSNRRLSRYGSCTARGLTAATDLIRGMLASKS